VQGGGNARSIATAVAAISCVDEHGPALRRDEEATRPSGTDTNFQERLETAGHVAVMAIFSRDGFVRFIRLDENLEIEIYGEGVEKHETGIYRLTNLG
jgi:hypothetical protein